MSDRGGEESHLGLGYNPSVQSSSDPASSTETADVLMKHYLQQCLAYHEEQGKADIGQKPSSLQFLPSSQQEDKKPSPQGSVDSPPDLPQDPPPFVPPVAAAPSSTETDTTEYTFSIAAAATKARAKAMLILQKFQQQQETTEESDYSRKRQAFMEREKQRKRRALLKNLEYVAQREEKRLQEKLALIDQARLYQEQIHRSHQGILEQRQSHAGIGSVQRRAKETHESVAVYLSGLPTDGSIAEDTVRQLFSSYGNIRKVHFYRHKETGLLKGDALVVYQLSGGGKEELLQSVCSQMNGAELPCGSVLLVEPADPDYDKKSSASKKNDPVKTTQTVSADPVDSKKAGGEPAKEDTDEDLDDFFASL